jgi:hypothetical protein
MYKAAPRIGFGHATPVSVFAEIDTNNGGFVLFDELCHLDGRQQIDWGASSDDVSQTSRQVSPKPLSHELPRKSVKTLNQELVPEGLQERQGSSGGGSHVRCSTDLTKMLRGSCRIAEPDKGIVMSYPYFEQ